MAWPDLAVRIAFASDPGSAPTWTDVTDYVRALSVRRGRQHELDRFEAGTMHLALDNRDRRFDPTYGGVLVNLLTNPSVETGTAGWGPWGTATLTRGTTYAAFGTYGLRVQCNNANGVCAGAINGVSATIGNSYTASIYLRVDAGSVRLKLCRSDTWAALATAGPYTGTARRQVTWTADADRSIRIVLEAAENGTDFYFDAAQVEVSAATTAYTDGDQDNCRWSGTAHASTSYRGGPYYPNVLPMRRVQVVATKDAVTYYLYTGFIESWPQRWPGGMDATAELDMTDGFKLLAMKQLNESYSEQLSSARVAAVLDDASWPSADRAIETGQTTVQAGTLQNVPALQHLHDVQLTENGRLFVDGRGRVVFHDRHRPLKPPYDASAATFGDGAGELPYTDLELSYDDSQVWNEVIVQRVGGTAQTATDATSQARYLVRTLSRTNMLQTSDAECADAANWLLSHFKDAQLRVTAITVQPDADDALWPHVLGGEIGDRITVVRRPPGGGDPISRDYIIEGIEHDVEPGRWQTRWRLSPAEMFEYWVLGHATLGVLGSTTRLAY